MLAGPADRVIHFIHSYNGGAVAPTPAYQVVLMNKRRNFVRPSVLLGRHPSKAPDDDMVL